MSFRELHEYCQIEAILGILTPNELSEWRSICRSYSKKFSTPLHLCLDGTIPPEDILLAEFEDQLEDVDPEENADALLDRIYSIEDPEYEKQKRAELEEFIEKAEAEEAERVSKGKPIHKALKDEVSLKSLPEKIETPKRKLPTGGQVSFPQTDEEG